MKTENLIFSAICSIIAAVGYNFAASPDMESHQQAGWFFLAISFTLTALVFAIGYLSQNTHIIDALADALVRVIDKRLRWALVVASMTLPQLTVYENSWAHETVDDFDTGEHLIRMNGIELNEAWLNSYLTTLEPSAPDFLPIRYDRDAKEMAAINVFVMYGWAKKRVSRVAVWINGHSPQTAREALELEV